MQHTQAIFHKEPLDDLTLKAQLMRLLILYWINAREDSYRSLIDIYIETIYVQINGGKI